MRPAPLVVVASLALVAACSKKPDAAPTDNATAQSAAATTPAPATSPPAAAGPAVSGTYTGDGKPATLTQIAAYPDEPFDDKPVTAVVITAKDQGSDPKDALFSAGFGKFGEAVVIRVTPDGNVIGAELVHPGLQPNGAVSVSGVLTLENYRNADGQISGHLTSKGDQDIFGHKLNLDLTFHTKAP